MPKNRTKNSPRPVVEEPYIKDFLDMVAPSVIDFKVDHYLCGNTCRCVWALREYPTSTDEQAILRHLGEMDGVTIRIYTRQVTASEEKRIIHNAANRNRMSRSSTEDLQQTVTAEANLQDVVTLVSTMHRNREPLLHCAVFLELTASSYDALKLLQTDVLTELVRSKLNVDRLLLRQREGFVSVMPSGWNHFGEQFERVLPASSVANLYPFNYSGKTDPHGFYIGKDKYGANILVDFDKRDDDKTSANILILGNSGEGKSYLMKSIIVNTVEAGKKAYILDPDDEYGDLVRNLGGTYLNMMSGEYQINVLEPRRLTDPVDEYDGLEDAAEPAAFKESNTLSQHIAYLRDFFFMYRGFTEKELDIIEIMLTETYHRRGIDKDSNFSRLSSKDYPILSDLYRVIEQKVENYEEEVEDAKKHNHPIMYSLEQLKAVGLGLRSICIGAASRYFNGHTNIPDADLIDFSVKETLNTNENLKNAMFMNAFSYMSHKFLTEGDCNLFVDELHEFVENRLAISYITSFMKRGRKKNSGVCIGSQNVEDLLRPTVITYTKPLMLLPTHSFLFHPGINCNPGEFQRALNVQPWEYDLIRIPNRGHCLYKCGNERYHLHVRAPAYKAALFGTAGGA